jgi:hypothetical protein
MQGSLRRARSLPLPAVAELRMRELRMVDTSCHLAQGDVLVSEALATIFARQAERDGSPNRLAACFIHEVRPGPPAQFHPGIRHPLRRQCCFLLVTLSWSGGCGGTLVCKESVHVA